MILANCGLNYLCILRLDKWGGVGLLKRKVEEKVDYLRSKDKRKVNPNEIDLTNQQKRPKSKKVLNELDDTLIDDDTLDDDDNDEEISLKKTMNTGWPDNDSNDPVYTASNEIEISDCTISTDDETDSCICNYVCTYIHPSSLRSYLEHHFLYRK